MSDHLTILPRFRNHRMRKLFAFLGLLGVIGALADQHGVFDRSDPPAIAQASADTLDGCDTALAGAYANHRNAIEVCGRGVVARVLKEDRDARHQRLIVRLPTGRTVLIAHNVDIAPRIEGLRPGSPIEFAGEYEWNEQGGVVHWTHHDPSGRHSAGWIRYGGRVYS